MKAYFRLKAFNFYPYFRFLENKDFHDLHGIYSNFHDFFKNSKKNIWRIKLLYLFSRYLFLRINWEIEEFFYRKILKKKFIFKKKKIIHGQNLYLFSRRVYFSRRKVKETIYINMHDNFILKNIFFHQYYKKYCGSMTRVTDPKKNLGLDPTSVMTKSKNLGHDINPAMTHNTNYKNIHSSKNIQDGK